jgi:hypothetical protein
MLEIILDSLVPIFFGMGLGYVAGWTRDIDNKQVGVLNALGHGLRPSGGDLRGRGAAIEGGAARPDPSP